MDVSFRRNGGSRDANVIDRRSVLALIGAVLTPSLAHAAQYPSRPIKIIVPFGPGGSGDITARLIGKQIEEEHSHERLHHRPTEIHPPRAL